MDADSVYRMILTRGRQVTLRRLGNSPPDDVLCYAMVARGDDVIGTGGVAQFRRLITISHKEIAAAGWPAPPRRGDQLIDGGRTMTIQAVESPSTGVILHRLETWGA